MNNTSTRKKIIINTVVFALMLALGAGGFMLFMGNKPKITKKKVEKKVITVEVMNLAKEDIPMQITGTGRVIPARLVELKPEVSGTISWVAPQFASGGIIKKGDVILRIDSRDYELDLRKSQSSLASAEASLMLEKGQQRVAQEGIRILGAEDKKGRFSTDLALRKPQLMQAEAAVAKAKVEVEQAKLNIQRCELRAPFNTLVRETNADLGSRITTSTTLATLVGIDEYWVETAVPVDRLENLGLSRSNIAATIIRQGGNSQWKGKVVRLKGSLTDSTRLARVVVAIKDPRGLTSKQFSMPLMLGDYVDVTITGNTIKSVFRIPRNVIHNENELWLYKNGELEVRKLAIVWKTPTDVFATTGVNESDQVIASHLSHAYSGMSIAVHETLQHEVAKKNFEKNTKKKMSVNNPNNGTMSGNKTAAAE